MIFGIGINDVPGICNTPVYKCWAAIHERCYSQAKLKRYPTYIGTSICDEWHTLSNFKRWYDKHHIDGTTIDKDIANPFNMEYSPGNCMFVSKWLNNLFKEKPPSTRISRNNGLPVGVDLHFGRYRAQMNNIPLGRFDNPEDAERCYVKHKRRFLADLIDSIRSEPNNPKYKCSHTEGLIHGLHLHMKQMQPIG